MTQQKMENRDRLFWRQNIAEKNKGLVMEGFRKAFVQKQIRNR